MRKLILIALLLSLLLTACDTQGPNLGNDLSTLPTNPVITEPLPTQSTTPATEPTTPLPEYPYTDLICGIYAVPNMEAGTAQYLQLYSFNDNFLLEFSYWEDGECLDFWCHEFWPDGQVYDDLTVSGLNQMFYDPEEGYLYGPNDFSITLDGDHLILTTNGNEKLGYVRENDFEGVHTPSHQLHEALCSRYTAVDGSEIAGSWHFYNFYAEGVVTFSPDGQFRYICKTKHEPVLYMEGAWIIDSKSGNILCMYQRPGRSNATESLRLEWQIDEGCLVLMDVDDTIPLMSGCCFTPIEDGWISALGIYDHADYVNHRRLEEGSYYVDGEFLQYYYYSIPQLIIYSETTERINQQIFNYLDPMISAEMEEVYNGGYRYYGYIEWEQEVRDGIVSILITEIPIYYYRDFRVFLYDTLEDKQLSSRELLARMGLDEEAVLDHIRSEMERIYRETYGPEYLDTQEYKDGLEWTLSEDNITLDVPIYIGLDCLVACVHLGSPYEDVMVTTVDIPLP